jgi:hypothetical protein
MRRPGILGQWQPETRVLVAVRSGHGRAREAERPPHGDAILTSGRTSSKRAQWLAARLRSANLSRLREPTAVPRKWLGTCPIMTDSAVPRIAWRLMAPHALSDAEFVTLTSRVVAACCQATSIDAAHLPALIASVNKALRGQLGLAGKKRSAAPPTSRSVSTAYGRDADRPQHTLRVAPNRFSRGEASQPNRGSSASGTNVVHLSGLSKPR